MSKVGSFCISSAAYVKSDFRISASERSKTTLYLANVAYSPMTRLNMSRQNPSNLRTQHSESEILSSIFQAEKLSYTYQVVDHQCLFSFREKGRFSIPTFSNPNYRQLNSAYSKWTFKIARGEQICHWPSKASKRNRQMSVHTSRNNIGSSSIKTKWSRQNGLAAT